MSATRDEEMSGTQDDEDSSQLRRRSALEGKHMNEETDEEDGQVRSDGVPDEQHQHEEADGEREDAKTKARKRNKPGYLQDYVL